MNTSRGGLTDAGRSYIGFLNLFYSIISILILPTLVADHKDLSLTILTAGVGVCNLLMIFAVPVLAYFKKINKFAKYVMLACAIYVCIVGTAINYHFYPILFGHFIWCLAFVIVAIAASLKIKNQNVLS